MTHFCFYYYYYLLQLFFLSARDNETIRDQLTSGKSPLPNAFVATARSVCSRTVDTPTDELQCFPYADLFVAGRNNIHRPLPSAPASHTIFSNFQTLLAAFFPITGTYWQTQRLFGKTLAMVQLEDVSSTVPRALALTPGAVSPLSASILCSERQRSRAFSWPWRSKIVNKSFTKQRFQAPVAYWLFGLLNMNIIRLLICSFVIQTQAVRWMTQNSNIAKTTAYSHNLVLV